MPFYGTAPVRGRLLYGAGAGTAIMGKPWLPHPAPLPPPEGRPGALCAYRKWRAHMYNACWQFELDNRRCLTSEGHRLYAQPVAREEASEDTTSAAEGTVIVSGEDHQAEENTVRSIRKECSHCWYVPSRWPTSSQK